MNQDIKIFEELLRNDKSVQEQLKAAIGCYSGDPGDEKCIFESVILPIAKEAGLSATFEDYQEYIKQLNSEAMKDGAILNADELSQVAGGKSKGIGALGCYVIGAGMGATGGDGTGGVCLLLGVGWEASDCSGKGEPYNIDIESLL